MATVNQLTGPGVEGLEDEAPTYHWDMSPEEFEEYLANPVEFGRKIGLPEGIGVNIHLVRWTEGWAGPEKGWISRTGETARPPVIKGFCCVGGSDGGCHAHC